MPIGINSDAPFNESTANNLRFCTSLQNGPPISNLGLGCSRLGSTLVGANVESCRTLIHTALDVGISFFDTADIYGQGDSERILGKYLSKNREVVICTKAGQRFPLHLQALAPLKPALASFIRRSSTLRRGASEVRSRELPRDYSPNYLRRAAIASIRRLRREAVDLLLAHSPSAADWSRYAFLDTLDALKREGLVRWIGVSCDHADELALTMQDERVDAIQVPYGIAQSELAPQLASRRQGRPIIIAREILTTARGDIVPNIDEAIRYAANNSLLDSFLVGTTSATHLAHAAAVTSIETM